MKSRSAERKRRMLILGHLTPSIQIQRNFDKGDEVLTPYSSDEFFADCGGYPQASLSIQNGEGLEEEFTFEDRPYLLVGRSMLCDIRLNHHDVSYRHAYFQIWDGKVFFLDLASRTGTFRDAIARHSGFFRPGSCLNIGPYTISNSELSSGSQIKSSLSKDAIPQLPETKLEITKSQSTSVKKKVRSIRRPVTLIGNSPSCKIRLEDDSVSRVHCSLVLTNKGLWAVDLLGKDGIKVNGERTPFALLEQGDELEVGKFRLGQLQDDVEALEEFGDSDEFDVADEQWRSTNTETKSRPKPKKRRQRKKSVPSNENHNVSTENSVQLSIPASSQQLNLSETFVLTLVEQFASMQQQILNQSNQHMMMMSQLFSTMHQSQQELIRDDLHRVHEISMELERLQHEMLKEKSLTLLTESRQIDGSDLEGGNEPQISSENRTDERTQAERDTIVKEMIDGEEDQRFDVEPSERATPDESSGVELTSAERTDFNDQEQLEEDSHGIQERRKEKVSGGVHSHAWLTQRMNDLEKEKTSRWQKIMKVLSRK